MATNQNNFAQIAYLGVNSDDFKTLRRISMTLRRWYENECSGTIQRDGDDGEGLPYWYSSHTCRRLYRAPDRERGAVKRLQKIMARYPDLVHYLQTDPRGCSLYLIPREKAEGRDLDAIYSARGYPVY